MTEVSPIGAGLPTDTRPHPLRLTIEEFVMLEDAGVFSHSHATASLNICVADVRKRVIHQMWLVEDGKYRRGEPIRFRERLASATISGLEIDTDFPI